MLVLMTIHDIMQLSVNKKLLIRGETGRTTRNATNGAFSDANRNGGSHASSSVHVRKTVFARTHRVERNMYTVDASSGNTRAKELYRVGFWITWV